MHAIPKEHRDKLVGLAARKEAFSALGVFRIMSVVHAHQPLRGCYATGIPQMRGEPQTVGPPIQDADA